MSEGHDVAPVRRTVTVDASVEEAFEIFTQGMGTWWPRGGSHTLLRTPLQQVTIEPFVGGRWFHTGTDGSECDLGRVLVWEPPTRLVLGWQINGRWQYVPDVVSEVELRFAPHGDGKAQVSLEHRALGVFGETAAALRAAVDSRDGWPVLLDLFAAAAARANRQ